MNARAGGNHNAQRRDSRPVFSASASAAAASLSAGLGLALVVATAHVPVVAHTLWRLCLLIFHRQHHKHMTSRTCTSNQPARQAMWLACIGGEGGATKCFAINNSTQHAYYYCWSALWHIWRCLCTHNLITLQWGNSIYNPLSLCPASNDDATSAGRKHEDEQQLQMRIYWTHYWSLFQYEHIAMKPIGRRRIRRDTFLGGIYVYEIHFSKKNLRKWNHARRHLWER